MTTDADARLDPSGGCDPFDLAAHWLTEAEASELNDPNAMALATVDETGMPNVRMVLMKEIEKPTEAARGGFVFYTNYDSKKGQELAATPKAALVIHWKSKRRQIRARGAVVRTPDAQADAYYKSRSYQSRIGAWASRQSQPLSARAALMAEAALVAARYPIDPPRPPHWGGFKLIAEEIEFWSDGAHRLHDRFRWLWSDGGWEVQRLNP